MTIDDLALRVQGRGRAALDARTALPIAVGDLDVGETVVVRVFANVSDAVKRLSLRATGVFATVVGQLRSYKGDVDNINIP